MSYTHDYKIHNWKSEEWQKAWPQLLEDVPQIIEEAGIPLQGALKDTPPLVDRKEGIFINGVGDDGHDPLHLRPRSRFLLPAARSFVNTGRKDYDVVVCCVLLRAALLAPQMFELRSDGDWDQDWEDARALFKTIWPHGSIWCPWKNRFDATAAGADHADGNGDSDPDGKDEQPGRFSRSKELLPKFFCLCGRVR